MLRIEDDQWKAVIGCNVSINWFGSWFPRLIFPGCRTAFSFLSPKIIRLSSRREGKVRITTWYGNIIKCWKCLDRMVEGCLHNLLLQVSVKIACKSVTLELFHMVSNGLKCCNRLGIVNSKIRRAPVRGGKSGVVNVSDYHYFTHIYRDLYLCSNLTPKYTFLLKLTKIESTSLSTQ